MPATGQSDNAIQFTFDQPRHGGVDINAIQAAISAEGGDTPAAAEPAASASPAEPAASAASAEPGDTDTSSPSAASAPAQDLKTHTIKVDGKELVVTEKDLLEGHMRHRDYTQKTQRLADQERQWTQEKAQLQTELQAIDGFLRDRVAIEAYMQKAFGQSGVPAGGTLPQPPQIDPNRPPTVAEVAAIARYNAEVVRQDAEQKIEARFQQALAASQQERLHAANLARVEDAVDTHISTLLEKYPVLAKFEDIEDKLMADAHKYKPRSLDEAKERLSEAADRWMAVIQTSTDDTKKHAAIAAAKLKTQGIEAPGGTAPRQAAGKKLTFASSDKKALLEAAEADLRAALAQ